MKQPIDETELTERFRNAPNSPLWEAVLAVIDDTTLDAIDQAAQRTVPVEEKNFLLGSVDGLQQLRQRLAEYEAAAREQPPPGTT